MTLPPPYAAAVRPRSWLAGLAGGACAGLLAGASALGGLWLALCVFVVQVGVALAWIGLLGATGAAGSFVVAIGAAIAGDLFLAHTRERPAGGLAGVLALAFIAALAHQLFRRHRQRVTASLATTLSAVALVVALSTLVGLASGRAGRDVLVAWALALAVGLPIGRLVDSSWPYLQIKGSQRGVPGLVAGLASACAVGVVIGPHLHALSAIRAAGIAAAAVLAAAVGDLALDLGVSDVAAEDNRRRGALRPLSALLPISLAAPAAYIAGRILLG